MCHHFQVMECGTDSVLTVIHIGVLLHILQSPTSLIVVLKMARYSSQSNEVELKCHECEIIFRHSESVCVEWDDVSADMYEQEFKEYGWMWMSPCCQRRYRLLEGSDKNKPCALILYGALGKYERGLDWAWLDEKFDKPKLGFGRG